MTLLLAGHETTKNLIANSILTLLRRPDDLSTLSATPELLPTAIEESLRFESPIQRAWRRVACDIKLDGHRIERGQLVYLMLGSANRDEDVFTAPERFDLRRSPNKQLASGAGFHFCVGAHLARLEGIVTLERLLACYPDAVLAEGPVTWTESVHIRCPVRLAVRLNG